MTNETAKALLQTTADIAAVTYNAQMRITALETVLNDPALFASYQKEVGSLRRSPPYEVNLAGYAALQPRLVQE